MRVAIAIVSYRSHGDLGPCLAALAQSDHRDFEVIICENGGREAYEALSALPTELAGGQAVRAVLADRNLGYAGGVNRCIAEAPSAEAWWILNPDTEAHPRALAEMVARLERGDCDAVGCTVGLGAGRIQSYGGLWRRQVARAVSLGYGASVEASVDADAVEQAQNYLNGASMLVGRRFVEATGLMREDYFLYCEEVEWCLRGIEAGMKLGFAPDAFVLHHHGTSTGNSTSLRDRSALSVYLDERNKILVTRDRFPSWLLPATLAALALLLLRFARARAWRQLRQALRGWLAGVRGDRGPPGPSLIPSPSR